LGDDPPVVASDMSVKSMWDEPPGATEASLSGDGIDETGMIALFPAGRGHLPRRACATGGTVTV